MSKISLDYNGKTYTLEFTRASVATMERQGFQASEVSGKLATSWPVLFAGAFLANHRHVKKSEIDEIFERTEGRYELFEELIAMYADTVTSLFEAPEDDGKNASWKKS